MWPYETWADQMKEQMVRALECKRLAVAAGVLHAAREYGCEYRRLRRELKKGMAR